MVGADTICTHFFARSRFKLPSKAGVCNQKKPHASSFQNHFHIFFEGVHQVHFRAFQSLLHAFETLWSLTVPRKHADGHVTRGEPPTKP